MNLSNDHHNEFLYANDTKKLNSLLRSVLKIPPAIARGPCFVVCLQLVSFTFGTVLFTLKFNNTLTIDTAAFMLIDR